MAGSLIEVSVSFHSHPPVWPVAPVKYPGAGAGKPAEPWPVPGHLLVTLLFFGSVSDYLGRLPVIISLEDFSLRHAISYTEYRIYRVCRGVFPCRLGAADTGSSQHASQHADFRFCACPGWITETPYRRTSVRLRPRGGESAQLIDPVGVERRMLGHSFFGDSCECRRIPGIVE